MIHYASTLFLVAIISIQASWAVRVYTHLLQPKENPDYDRYRVIHPSLEVFEPLPQFATLRNLPSSQAYLINYTQAIDKYCLNPNTTLGGILWPVSPSFMFSDNYKDFIDYIKEKGLYITSVHGFSPVSAGYRPPKSVLEYMEATLGSHWFGIANGEQDGHYFGAFIREEMPLNNPPLDQYLNFRDYFDRMEHILGPRLTTLLSSTYPHYQLKTGLYTLAGAETSQHGPNAQLRYSFIRGAGKQYGVIWFGNVSIYNRFGHKVYSKKKKASKTSHQTTRKIKFSCVNYTSMEGYDVDSFGDPFGPSCGTSLNLMKRLMYAQMMYNSGYVSFEGNWFYESNKGNDLSPIGLIQHNAYKWVSQKKVSLGKHLATVAIYLDYFNGWASPRQNKGVIYRTWMNLPYVNADYLTDGLLRLLYPHYQDSSYFHDETGVSSPTPYGDIVDVILTDAPVWVLKAYDTIFVSSQLAGGEEIARNLFDYVQSGGNLVITAGNLATLPRGYFNVSVTGGFRVIQAGEKVYLHSQKQPITERYNMTVRHLEYTQGATILAWLKDSTPLAIQIKDTSGGTLVVLATSYAVSSTQTNKPVSEIDEPITTPFPLLDHASLILHSSLSNASIIKSTTKLSIVTNYVDTDKLLVLVSNPLLEQQPLKFVVQNGEIINVKEIILDQSEKGQIGYLPDGYENADIGKSTPTTIAGGDTRLFQVTTTLKMTEIDKPSVKPRPIGIALHIRHIRLSLRREINSRPTFFQHYDSVVIDYSYLITKDEEFLVKERNWIATQRVKVYVDATPSLDLFPTLRLTSDAPDLYNESMSSFISLLKKMAILGSHDLILSLHIFPGDQSKESTFEQFNTTLQFLRELAKPLNITLHILDTPKNQLELLPMSRWLETYSLSSISFALSTSALLAFTDYKYDTILTTRTSMLYINAPGWDLFGLKYTNNEAISKNQTTELEIKQLLKHICSLVCCPYAKSPKTQTLDKLAKQQNHMYRGTQCNNVLPFVMDSVYLNQDEEYSDIRAVEQLLAPQ
ncbi:uncharacterized protein LOC135349038 [Halichondria panicea]|uniref:uncharacterized protein LOC135349038 n=1 Tax=Halichondria panicea TaxID=6063 RepID=UPI00312BB1C4